MGETDLSTSGRSLNDAQLPNGLEHAENFDSTAALPTEPDLHHEEEDTFLGHSRSIRSMTSKRSFVVESGQSLRSMTSRASFLFESTGGGGVEMTEEEEEAILTEMVRGGAAVPPDGGYGWVIVFVSFLSNLVLDGITCTFGVFLPKMAESFDAGKGQVAWAGSLLCGGSLCIGPIVGACTNKFGCRAVCMAGSLIACIGFIISSFAESLTVMLLSYGVLGAIGFGFIYLPNIVSVGYYFEKRRALATGIAVCGSGFGATSFAPMASWLINQTSWRNVNLMYAGLLFMIGCFGALIRPLEIKREALDDFAEDEGLVDPDPKKRPLLYRMAEERKHHMDRSSMTGSEYFMVQLPDGTVERRQKMPINVDPGVHSTFHLDQFQFAGSHTPQPPLTPIHPPLSTITEAEKQGSDSEGSKGSVAAEVKDDTKEIESDPHELEMPPSRRSSFNREFGVRSPQVSYRRGFEGSKGSGVDHGPDPCDEEFGGRRPSFSMRAVPVPIMGNRHPTNIFKRSISSPNESRRGSMSESVDESIAPSVHNSSKLDLPGIHPSLKWTQGSLAGSSGSVHRIIRPLSRKDVFYSGSITQLPEYQNPVVYRQSILSLPRFTAAKDDGTVVAKPTVCPTLRRLPTALLTALQTYMDFSLLKNPVFLCIALSGVVGMLGFYVPFVYIIDFCAEKNIPRDDGALLISIIGVMNTVGRVGFGMLSDMRQVNSLYVNNFCLLGMGVAVMSVPWCPNFGSLVTVYVLFGLFLSGFIALTSITLVDLLGLDNLTNAFSLLIFFRGFASIIGSPFAGFLFDTFQSYDVPFVLAGAFLVTSALISSTIPLFSKLRISIATPTLTNPFPQPPTHLEDIPEAREPDEDFYEPIRGTSTPLANGDVVLPISEELEPEEGEEPLSRSLIT